MSVLDPFFARQAAAILDGGLATELERRGADLSGALWSATYLLDEPGSTTSAARHPPDPLLPRPPTGPDLLRQLHYDYFAAGADIGTSASYQATFAGLMNAGLSADEAEAAIRRSVNLVREARDAFWSRYQAERSPTHASAPSEPASSAPSAPESSAPESSAPSARRPAPSSAQLRPAATRLRPLVAASAGSYGAYLADGSEYRGDYGLTLAELKDFHRPRLAVLATSGADLIALETIPSLLEARALVELLGEFPYANAWLAFSCADDRHVCHGERLSDCVAAVQASPQLLALGVNCSAPRLVEDLLRRASGATTKPLVAYPNAGEAWDAATRSWHPTPDTLDDWGAAARQWHAAGARLIGGCCRTGPAELRAIRAGILPFGAASGSA